MGRLPLFHENFIAYLAYINEIKGDLTINLPLLTKRPIIGLVLRLAN